MKLHLFKVFAICFIGICSTLEERRLEISYKELKRRGDFPGMRKDGYQYLNISSIGLGQCGQECVLRRNCKSFNYNLETFECELNKESVLSKPYEGWTDDPKWFHGLKVTWIKLLNETLG
ncbi:hypothetical protein CHS0354_025272 [Potamilus streckersoni]|uniref:Apple domain-containing protein n=1 Tax=Potamilus streckersoni TaxID=2493646 RepID=A0AAE0RS03_9BIVA|nr:hypothetical protein CHS0354_025272 [Potamilus streckersoni]